MSYIFECPPESDRLQGADQGKVQGKVKNMSPGPTSQVTEESKVVFHVLDHVQREQQISARIGNGGKISVDESPSLIAQRPGHFDRRRRDIITDQRGRRTKQRLQ